MYDNCCVLFNTFYLDKNQINFFLIFYIKINLVISIINVIIQQKAGNVKKFGYVY